MPGFEADGAKKLLIVDDSLQVQTLLRHVFSEIGYRVSAIGGEADVLGTILAIRPDLLVMNVRVGEKSGIRFCQQLTERAMLPDLPVIFMAHSADVTLVQAAMQAGAVGFFTKPLEVQEMCARVDDVLGRTLRASDRAAAA